MKYLIILMLFCHLHQNHIVANHNYFFLLTNGAEKIWWLNNQFLEGWCFRADSSFSYVRLNVQKQVEVITWVDPDVSYGNGIFKWQLSQDTLHVANIDYRMIRVTTDSLYLLDPNKGYGRDTIILVNNYNVRTTKQ